MNAEVIPLCTIDPVMPVGILWEWVAAAAGATFFITPESDKLIGKHTNKIIAQDNYPKQSDWCLCIDYKNKSGENPSRF